MFRKIIISCILFYTLLGCSICSTRVVEFGNNFALSEYDNEDIIIVYSMNECYDYGTTVVPMKVLGYNYDDKWIIAKSLNDGSVTYWIINKSFDYSKRESVILDEQLKQHTIGPIDSLQFIEEMKKHDIKLRLKDVHEK